MDGGAMVAEGTGDELKRQVTGRRLELELFDEASFWHVRDLLDGSLLGSSDENLTVAVASDGDAAQVRALLDRVDPSRGLVKRFAFHEATLDDVFLALTGNPTAASSQKETADV
jgi:ABC-2 type transport system ATP-binding protein